MKKLNLLILAVSITLALFPGCIKNQDKSKIYYVNSTTGEDSNDGLSPKTAWKTLERASQVEYGAGEQLLLGRGCTFQGKLELKATGSKEKPVVVSSYNSENSESNLPVIDAKGYLAAVSIKNGKYIQI